MSAPSSMSAISRIGSPMPRPPGSSRRLDREHLAVGGQHQDLGRGLGEEGGLQGVVALVGEARQVRHVALEGAHPALLGEHDGDRLALDHGRGEIDVGRIGRAWRTRCGAGRAACPARTSSSPRGSARRSSSTARPEASSASIPTFSLLSASCSRRSSISSSRRKRAQAGVEHVVGLHLGEPEGRLQHVLRLVLLADDADHLVEVEERRSACQPALRAGGRSGRAGGASGAPARRGDGRATGAAPRRATTRAAPRPPTSTFMLSGMRLRAR